MTVSEVRAVAKQTVGGSPQVIVLPSGRNFWIGWRDDEKTVDLNTATDLGILYLLTIEIPKRMRGTGFGTGLCEQVVDMARELGLTQVRQTPSGTAWSGERRMNWLARRGWTEDGHEAYRTITPNRDMP